MFLFSFDLSVCVPVLLYRCVELCTLSSHYYSYFQDHNFMIGDPLPVLHTAINLFISFKQKEIPACGTIPLWPFHPACAHLDYLQQLRSQEEALGAYSVTPSIRLPVPGFIKPKSSNIMLIAHEVQYHSRLTEEQGIQPSFWKSRQFCFVFSSKVFKVTSFSPFWTWLSFFLSSSPLFWFSPIRKNRNSEPCDKLRITNFLCSF